MTATATITLSGTLDDAPSGSKQFAGTLSSAAACPATLLVALSTSFAAITVPTLPAPTGVMIKLPAGNTHEVTLKGVTGDTGIKIGKTGWTVLSWDPASIPTTFGMVAAGTVTNPAEVSFF
jgi:hypothetical protein